MQKIEITKNSTIELHIDKLTYGGRGIGRYNNFVVFVENAVPDDFLSVRIVKKNQNFAEGIISEILTPSPKRIKPPCPYFEICGGCSWQNVPYKEQLFYKHDIVKTSIEHISGVDEASVSDIIPAPSIWAYRNKMDFTFGYDASLQPALGFHKKESFDTIIDIERCLIQPYSFNTILKILREEAIRQNIEFYNPRSHKGFLRSLIIREGKSTGEIIVILLTNYGEFRHINTIVERVKEEVPRLKGFLWGYNAGVADIARMEKPAFTYGDLLFIEMLGSTKYRISPFSFFQTNTAAAEILLNKIKEFLELSGEEVLLDAYCGTGSIGIYCAREVKHVFGIECVIEAVFDARENAKINNLNNCTFISGVIQKGLPIILSSSQYDINRIVVDPPRGGMHKQALKMLLSLNVPIFVYVSCNPTTLARDISEIIASGYKIEKIQPVDMFPHTYHIETVVKFKK